MKYRKATTVFFLVCVVFILFRFSQEILIEIQRGVETCLYQVIPALFPFVCISPFFILCLKDTKIIRFLEYCYDCPINSGGILLAGLLGGYPIGAKSLSEVYHEGWIDRTTAKRMLLFCSNCGPAFFLGLVSAAFPNLYYGLLLWGIHILSSVLIAKIIPQIRCQNNAGYCCQGISFSMKQSVITMGIICGWVVLFQIPGAIFPNCPIWLSGLLEITNGVLQGGKLSVPTRFIIFSVILGLGGFCVLFQTISFIKEIGVKYYIYGKFLQGGISFILSSILSLLLFSDDGFATPILLPIIMLILLLIYYLRKKITVEFMKDVRYNKGTYNEKRDNHVVSEKDAC